ncbi:KH domain-containing protein [Niabella defluvii]|nr:KH domain-containing protein [Niabella sp. I65]
MILIGEKGTMIKKLGTAARLDIEAFLGRKVFLELFVKVKPKWRDNDLHLKEYGYGVREVDWLNRSKLHSSEISIAAWRRNINSCVAAK